MIVAIIQARMNSTRFPKKVLADIVGRPMLWHVVNRVSQARLVDKVLVATSDKPSDDPVAEYCLKEGIEFFRGSEDDVLDRFYGAARSVSADTVVRITADCPLIDPVVIDKVIAKFKAGSYDYVSNVLIYTYPDGLDVEVFSFQALERARREADTPSSREHVTGYMTTRPGFRLGGVENEADLSQKKYRWTVDRPRDLLLIQNIYGALYPTRPMFLMDDILELLAASPELNLINQDTIRNEGCYISIAGDKNMMEPVTRTLIQSQAWLDRAKRLIPSQTQTFSKGPSRFVQGVSPNYLDRAQGSHVWDVDGNEYIDFIMGLCPVILGHNYPEVTEAVINQIKRGVAFSLPHHLEVELAEQLVEIIPCAEMVRYAKNGSDATTGAVRVARAYIGREKIACCGYHGWHDWYIGTTTRRLGIPKSTQALTLTFEYNKIETLEVLFAAHPGDIAAVIMEPVGVVEPENGFLARVKEVAHKNGALLILDEIVTGFRVALGGAQAHFGVTPDLGCFGKAMANGFPISTIVGRKDVMALFDEVFFSFTFGGDATALAAALATIKVMREKNIFLQLWDQGQKIKDGYNVLARECGLAEYTQCVGLPPHTVATFSDVDGAGGLVLASLMQQELIKRGVLAHGGANLCYSHSNADVEHYLLALKAAFNYLAKAIDSKQPRTWLEGEPIKEIFRKP
ncbi:MAG: aminotransferase class III-fold pyridoxal phosphate-dependent enzyme [Deltaproteobacteria bacterium]|nr:aminotransferase class III-fold pyridoxal phosphate-dependent enzyme [Deltaproteobacteria bacterium]